MHQRCDGRGLSNSHRWQPHPGVASGLVRASTMYAECNQPWMETPVAPGNPLPKLVLEGVVGGRYCSVVWVATMIQGQRVPW